MEEGQGSTLGGQFVIKQNASWCRGLAIFEWLNSTWVEDFSPSHLLH